MTTIKVGDTVRRLHHRFGTLSVGDIGVVTHNDGHVLKLEGHTQNFDPMYFELAKRAEAPTPKAPLSNPKQAYGDKKPPLHLVHNIALLHESTAMHSGRLKYGENNFIHTPVEVMTYIGAILRHTQAYASGERVDPKELVHHLGAVRACCNILLTAEATGMLIDNRPTVGVPAPLRGPAVRSYQTATDTAFAEASQVIDHLNKLYPKPV